MKIFSVTLIGPEREEIYQPEIPKRSVQHWYGEYNLPIAPYILSKEKYPDMKAVLQANSREYLTGSESQLLHNGYVVVHFELYTVRDKTDNMFLAYKAPIANMWEIEGQVTSDHDANGHSISYDYGDVILFDADYSAQNDIQGSGH